MPAITHVYVGLGSNLGDRAGNLLLALGGMLDAGLRVARLSSVYETEPVGVPTEQPLFLNMVAELALDAGTTPAPPSPEQLLARLLRIEYRLGRRRARPLAPRTIDLDLLLYGDALARTEYLTLPHPRLHLRRFVLAPLAELAPDAVHPILGRSFAALLSELSDASRVERWTPSGGREGLPESEIFN
ncbi:MAG TPA: 2-amino-4-hydroxy-6-hydroxymethyldihydropteridine diphosphokinase [Pyrinomonadaceae bacterium]|jgi:2-amino-4-hydroxy-6-hydroxymethyldihydropteridine diphosphokinase